MPRIIKTALHQLLKAITNAIRKLVTNNIKVHGSLSDIKLHVMKPSTFGTWCRTQLLSNFRQFKLIQHTNHYLGLRYKDNDYPREQARRCTSNEPRGTTQKTNTP